MSKNKKPVFGKKGIFYLILGGILFKLLSRRFKRKKPELSYNFRKFLHKEKNEMVELANGKESLGKYCKDSCSLFMDYFIPHECNGHKPKILRTRSLAVIAVMLVSMKLAVGGYLFLTYPNEAKMSEEIINKVLILVNSERKAQGLNELELNPSLSTFALDKANDLIAKDYFAHYSPDGKKPWDFIDRSQYAYLFVGENLAMNFTNADSVHRALMNSESHKKNILNQRYDDMGLAMATGVINGKTTNVLVQFFATRTTRNLAVETVEARTAGTTDQSQTVESIPVTNEQIAPITQESPEKPAPIDVVEEEPADDVPAGTSEPIAPPVEGEISQGPDSEAKPAQPEVEEQFQPEEEISGESGSRVASIVSENDYLERNTEALRPKIEHRALVAKSVSDVPASAQISTAEEPGSPSFFKANVSPNTDIDNYKMVTAKSFSNLDERFALTAAIVGITRIAFITILALVCLALALNIFIRLEVQHHSVILQTIFLLILISGLLYMRTHFLESDVTELLII